MGRQAIRKRPGLRQKRPADDRKPSLTGYERWERLQLINIIDERMGFERLEVGPPMEGWLINMHEVWDWLVIVYWVVCNRVEDCIAG